MCISTNVEIPNNWETCWLWKKNSWVYQCYKYSESQVNLCNLIWWMQMFPHSMLFVSAACFPNKCLQKKPGGQKKINPNSDGKFPKMSAASLPSKFGDCPDLNSPTSAKKHYQFELTFRYWKQNIYIYIYTLKFPISTFTNPSLLTEKNPFEWTTWTFFIWTCVGCKGGNNNPTNLQTLRMFVINQLRCPSCKVFFLSFGALSLKTTWKAHLE